MKGLYGLSKTADNVGNRQRVEETYQLGFDVPISNMTFNPRLSGLEGGKYPVAVGIYRMCRGILELMGLRDPRNPTVKEGLLILIRILEVANSF